MDASAVIGRSSFEIAADDTLRTLIAPRGGNAALAGVVYVRRFAFQIAFQERLCRALRAFGCSEEKWLSSGIVNGSDGTRTRDLRRDRPAF
jgi:hypothetical protein